ncbi:MAG TPA: cytochrome c-type biogenesis protein CcmH [Longimicrobiaceae bacterium]|nr:cytochrome c-type biogenesis protein CcmH [Longimicrobiaceae bacterium]
MMKGYRLSAIGYRRLRGMVVLLLLVGCSTSVYAQRATPATHAVAEDAISRLRSPYCPGLMLEVCPSAAAALLRDSIYDLAAQGMTASEIEEWMLARHGEEWRAVPKTTGVGLWAWVIPPLALLLGGGYIVARLRSATRSAPNDSEFDLAMDDTDRERLAAALREMEHAEAIGE